MSAILNYAYAELDLDKRNPFTRLIIRNEGQDASKRGTFTNEQLKQGYEKAIASGSNVKLLMRVLHDRFRLLDTGDKDTCRLPVRVQVSWRLWRTQPRAMSVYCYGS